MTDWPTRVQQPMPPQPRRETLPTARRRRRAIFPQFIEMLAIIGFLVLGYEGSLWLWAKTAPKEVTVPKIVALQKKEAETLLSSAGLGFEEISQKPSEDAPEGSIMTAEPGPGRTVKAGRVIRVTVSSGSRWSKVPDVGEMSRDRALAQLKQAGLVVKRERARYHDSVPVGYVIGQKPDPRAKVPKGTEVELVVSKGPEPQTETIEQTPPPSGPRSTDISVTVPPGASLQEVRIIVIDQSGERVAYREYHEPGEKITETVSGEGAKVTVKVYLSGILNQEKEI